MPRSSTVKLIKRTFKGTENQFYYIQDGKRRIATGVPVGPSTKSVAEKARREYLQRPVTPPTAEEAAQAHFTVTDALDYYAAYKGDSLHPEFPLRAAKLLAFFGSKKVEEMNVGHGGEYVAWRGHHGAPNPKHPPRPPRAVANGTIRRELVDLNAALNRAFKAEKVRKKVTMELPEASPPKERWLTKSEAARLLMGALGFVMVSYSDRETREVRWRVWRRVGESYSRHLARFVIIGLHTGTRHDAMLRLGFAPHPEGGHFDLANRRIYRAAIGARRTKKRQPTSRLRRKLAFHVARWKRISNSNIVVHYAGPVRRHDEDGNAIDSLKRITGAFRLARQRAGLGADVTPHVLRHTCTTWLLHEGWSIWDVAGYVGMSPKVIETTYGHHSAEFQAAAAD